MLTKSSPNFSVPNCVISNLVCFCQHCHECELQFQSTLRCWLVRIILVSVGLWYVTVKTRQDYYLWQTELLTLLCQCVFCLAFSCESVVASDIAVISDADELVFMSVNVALVNSGIQRLVWSASASVHWYHDGVIESWHCSWTQDDQYQLSWCWTRRACIPCCYWVTSVQVGVS